MENLSMIFQKQKRKKHVSVVNFEQVYAGWEAITSHFPMVTFSPSLNANSLTTISLMSFFK